MHVTVIGGAGSVGSTVAYTLATTVPHVRLRLVDVEDDAVVGHGTDIEHAMHHSTHPVGQAISSDVTGGTGVVSTATPNPEIFRNTDCIIVVYNVSRPENAIQRGGRGNYYEQNRSVADELAEWMSTTNPKPVIVITNPVDRITYNLWENSGWPRDYFVGYSLSETARAVAELGRLRDADPRQINCPTMGEHGENVVPVFSKTTVAGTPIDLSSDERKQVLNYIREIPYEIMRQRGPEKSSRWVSGRGAAAVAHTFQNGGTDEPVCLSVPLDGEYGYSDVSMSVPITLTSDGWDTIKKWSLSDWEKNRLDSAYEHLVTTG